MYPITKLAFAGISIFKLEIDKRYTTVHQLRMKNTLVPSSNSDYHSTVTFRRSLPSKYHNNSPPPLPSPPLPSSLADTHRLAYPFATYIHLHRIKLPNRPTAWKNRIQNSRNLSPDHSYYYYQLRFTPNREDNDNSKTS